MVFIFRQETQLGISQGEDQRGRELDGVRGQRGGGGDRRQYQVRGVTWPRGSETRDQRRVQAPGAGGHVAGAGCVRPDREALHRHRGARHCQVTRVAARA